MERSALPGGAFEANGSLVVFNDLGDNCQSKPGTRGLGSEEGSEELVPILLSDSYSRIGNSDLEIISVACRAEGKNAAGGHRIQSIGDQVDQSLAQLEFVDHCGGKRRIQLEN